MSTVEQKVRRAVIDVGTNSVKLLVADVGSVIRPVLKLSRQTRLGEGAFRAKWLQPEAIERTVAAVADLAAQATRLRVSAIRVLATCATREGLNSHELVEAIQASVGLRMEIITGEQEADYVFRGVTSDFEFAHGPVLIVDVGGGSTEWVVGEAGSTRLRLSTPIGTARLLELQPPSNPPTPGDLAACRRLVRDLLRSEVQAPLQPLLREYASQRLRLICVGGALKALARLTAGQERSEPNVPDRLGLAQVQAQVERLWRLSAEERRALAGVKPEKADVILAGAVIYDSVLDEFGFSELFVTQRGLRHGALLDPGTWTSRLSPTLVPI